MQSDNKIKFNDIDTPENLLKIIVRIFFSDLHIIIIDIILRDNYITEYSISRELRLGVDRIKIITNNLINEKLINYEERLFKNLKQERTGNKKKKSYKLRYLYFDRILFIHCIKKKFKKIVSLTLKNKIEESNPFLECSRKICGKVYNIKDINHLSIDSEKGIFLCTNSLSYNITCGSELTQKEKDLGLELIYFKSIKKLIDSVKI